MSDITETIVQTKDGFEMVFEINPALKIRCGWVGYSKTDPTNDQNLINSFRSNALALFQANPQIVPASALVGSNFIRLPTVIDLPVEVPPVVG